MILVELKHDPAWDLISTPSRQDHLFIQHLFISNQPIICQQSNACKAIMQIQVKSLSICSNEKQMSMAWLSMTTAWLSVPDGPVCIFQKWLMS